MKNHRQIPLRRFLFLLLFLAAPAFALDRSLYFGRTYEACRVSFADAVREFLLQTGATGAEQGSWKVPSATDDELFIDYFYLPPKGQPKNLILLTSGVHGIEGFAGNAVTQLFLREILPKIDRENTGIFVIHGINPWGFKYYRRVSENGVDLSRNFDVSPELFSKVNGPYRALLSTLNPDYPIGEINWARARTYFSMIRKMIRKPLRDLRQAILQGQYEFPGGLYFGGQAFEPQVQILRDALQTRAKSYARVLHYDIHTGYGKRGALHYLAGSVKNPQVDRDVQRIFSGFDLALPNAEDFYETSGDFADFATRIFLQMGKQVVPMLLEYGTLNNQTHLGGMDSLFRMIAENQLYLRGSTSEGAGSVARVQFAELYYPRSVTWRNRIMESTVREVPVQLRRFLDDRSETCGQKVAER